MIRPRLFAFAACMMLATVPIVGCRRTEWHNTPPFATEQPGQLELRITGDRENTIEAYFYNQGDLELFSVIAPPVGDNRPLTFGKTILIPASGLYGTFAVIYGNHPHRIKAFGWQPGKATLNVYELQQVSEVRSAEWVTPRILRVESADEHSELSVQIIEFMPIGDQAWKSLSIKDATVTQ